GHKDIATVVRQLSVRLSRPKLAKSLASYLARERRTSELDAIMREVARQRRDQDKVVEVDVTSANPLSDLVKREVKRLQNSKNVVINETVDKSVIGGVRMETSDSLLDLTVRTRLDQFKRGVKQ